MLDPQKAWDDVHALAAGNEPVILCWEQAANGVGVGGKDWCHRSLVAQWFQINLGHKVDEIGFEGKAHPLHPGFSTQHLVMPEPMKASREQVQRALFG